MKNVMKRAWEIYRTLQGDRLAKLSYALKQAWSEIRGGLKMVELVGSEKQIKWAKDLIKKMNKEVETWTQAINSSEKYKKEETRQKALKQLETVRQYINNKTNASEIIKEFKDFTNADRVDNMTALVRSLTGEGNILRAESKFRSLI